MAKYTIISDVGKALLALLKDKLVPDTVDKGESIGICDPKDRGDYIVGIHPYDIREDTSGKNTESISLPDGSTQDAPAMLELYYVISVNSKAEIGDRALDEAKIIGKIIQVLKDNSIIPSIYMPSNMGSAVEKVPISMLPLSMEEKVKVWTMFGESYKLSAFYVVGPVAIDSEKVSKPKKRVETVFLDSKHYTFKKVLKFETFIKEEDIDDEYTQRPDEDEDQDEDYGSDEEGGEDYGSEEEGGEDYGSDEEGGEDYGSDEEAGGEEGGDDYVSDEEAGGEEGAEGSDDLDSDLDLDSELDLDSDDDLGLDSDSGGDADAGSDTQETAGDAESDSTGGGDDLTFENGE